ncbi:fructokinase [Paenibacillus sp. UNCCL117]|uniref:carbohydrate kinase family protein n=1 Tax=unclassified Paenibacillus TaxID=185978 RepID=UPI000881CCDC|nr:MULTISPECIES: carbohydrate kinase [unclassified Paenibacillus]SDC64075.1 fructokinase [Paenibacillus sp. cl123]SFW22446.1 fructokinase [Paenibacillus sp. UNCCL117]
MGVVYTIGEALIDFIPAEKGVPLKEVNGFEKAAGGAPFNVACAVAKLGGRSGFIGKLGSDAFGDFLVETLTRLQVDVSHVRRTREAGTGLAFVSLSSDGNRDFSFYRNPSADMLLTEQETADIRFAAGDILHFCSVDLIEAPVKYAHRAALAAVREAGGLISFDPNVRLPLWTSPEACRKTILEFLPEAHIVKISDEELAFITGLADEEEAISSLFVGNVRHVVYTKGAEGALWHRSSGKVAVAGHAIRVADTTGAGDSFIGALLYQLHARGLGADSITEVDIRPILEFANAAAALTTTRKGAVGALPGKEEVLDFLAGKR